MAMILHISLSQVSTECLVFIDLHILHISLVPAPGVFISLNTDDDDDGPVYQGTELVITCTATVDSAVDTEFNVTIEWSRMLHDNNSSGSGQDDLEDSTFSGSGEELMNRLTISDTNGSGLEYTSTVTISPVDTTDSATYTCTASITPATPDTDYIMTSMDNSTTVNITVKGK